jgi:hypothetical protein
VFGGLRATDDSLSPHGQDRIEPERERDRRNEAPSRELMQAVMIEKKVAACFCCSCCRWYRYYQYSTREHSQPSVADRENMIAADFSGEVIEKLAARYLAFVMILALNSELSLMT